MLTVLFSPNGKIGSLAFMKAAVFLIAAASVLAVLPLIQFELGSSFKILSLALMWCWIVIFIKRFRFAGKSGWLCLVPILIYCLAYLIYASTLQRIFAPDLVAAMEELSLQAVENSDWAALMQISQDYAKPVTQKTALPLAIAGALVSYAIAYGTDYLLLRGSKPKA